MQENLIIGTDGSADSLTRYIYSNHLQSSALELDAKANVISYEEYHPFGTTSYHAKNDTINATAKRYRYTGKERDEESGLYYHGARYYIPWLCRWSAVDPLESKYAGLSSYNYSFNNPVMFNDPSGMGGVGQGVELPKGAIPFKDDKGENIAYLYQDHLFTYRNNEKIKNGKVIASGFFNENDQSQSEYEEDQLQRKENPISYGISRATYDIGQFAIDMANHPSDTLQKVFEGIKSLKDLDIQKTADAVLKMDLSDKAYWTTMIILGSKDPGSLGKGVNSISTIVGNLSKLPINKARLVLKEMSLGTTFSASFEKIIEQTKNSLVKLSTGISFNRTLVGETINTTKQAEHVLGSKPYLNRVKVTGEYPSILTKEAQGLLDHFKAGEGLVVSENLAHKSIVVKFNFPIGDVINPKTGKIITKGTNYAALKFGKNIHFTPVNWHP
jgi:RHS repeat-associated protein